MGCRALRVTAVASCVCLSLAAGAVFPAESPNRELSPAAKAEQAPKGRDIVWRSVGPGGGGWIQSIAFDPRDPDVLYVGCDVGGFYFSPDGGRHYELQNRGLRDYFVEAIEIGRAHV